jgi:hypothetical protein
VLAVFGDEATRWRPLADDDRFVRNQLRKTNRYDGGVFVKRIPAGKLSGYGSLVNALDVNQTPSVVIIDRDLKGTVLTGYVDRVAINQAIADARRVSITPNLTDTYLRKANSLCGRLETRLTRWSLPTVRGRKAFVASQKRELAIVAAYRHAVQRLAAPAKWRGLKAAWVAGLKRDEGVLAARVVYAKTGKAADLRKSNATCGHLETRLNRWSHPTVRGKQPLKASNARRLSIIRQYRRLIARTAAPAKYAGLKKQWLKVMTANERRAASAVTSCAAPRSSSRSACC